MESFDFPSSEASAGPTFLEEYPLKDYVVSNLMDKNTSICHLDFIPVDLQALCQKLLKWYYSVIEENSINTRSLGAGIVAASILLTSWKVFTYLAKQSKLKSINKRHLALTKEQCSTRRNDSGEPAASKTPSVPLVEEQYIRNSSYTVVGYLPPSKDLDAEEELVDMCEGYQRQLKDAKSKLESVKYRLKELEGDKDLLNAEIDTRKMMIQKLQEENSSEREKRQQAELKSEMMSIEHSQIRQLRNEISVKSAHVNRLERLMSEKDDLQMRLFSDNVVLPRCVVEARAKEFSELQNRVHQLQAELDSCKSLREYDTRCNPCGFSRSIWLENGSKSLPYLRHNDMPVQSRNVFHSEKPAALSEPVTIANKMHACADKSPAIVQRQAQSMDNDTTISRSTSNSIVSPSKTPYDVKYIRSQNNVLPTSKTNDQFEESKERPKNIRVFAQIKNLAKGLSKNSTEPDPANIALLSHLQTILGNNNAKVILKQVKDKSPNEKVSSSESHKTIDMERPRTHGAAARKSICRRVMPLKRLSRQRRDKIKDNSTVKRKLAVQYVDGQARLVELEDSKDRTLVSRELMHRNTMRVCSYLNQTECNTKNSVTDLEITNQAALMNYNQLAVHGEESYIVILPDDT